MVKDFQIKAQFTKAKKWTKSYKNTQRQYDLKAEKFIKTARRIDTYISNVLNEKEYKMINQLSQTQAAEETL